MNIQEAKAKFKNLRILLDSVYSPITITVRLIKKPTPKKDAVMPWHTQFGKITTQSKVEIYFTLHELSATKIVTWNCHVYDSAKGRNDTIVGGYI